jgi:signal transduction histidine kinase
MSIRAPRRFRALSLFWKLLIPFLALIVIVGAFGAFLIVRDLSSKAKATLNQDLLQSSLTARASLKDRELYLLESATFAANLQGMSDRVKRNDTAGAGQLLESVLALKTDLNLLVVTNRDGVGLVEFTRDSAGAELQRGAATKWADNSFIAQTLNDPEGKKSSGFVKLGEKRLLAIAAPVCSNPAGCSAVGAAVVALHADALAAEAAANAGESAPKVTLYDTNGSPLVGPGKTTPVRIKGKDLVRRTEKFGSEELFTLYAPLDVQGQPAGMVAVSLSPETAFSAVRGAGLRLALFLLVAMAGIVGIGAMLSRFILAQVKPLLATNRALGRGELSARTPVVTDDELGELARGVNQMAEQLQASHETLEMRVVERTEEVQRLLKERTEFFASLSHELRTPLAVILSQAQMLRDPGLPKRNGWVKEGSKTIEDSAEQLLALVNDILDLARAEAGNIEIHLEDLDLRKVVTDMRPTIEGLARANDIAVTFRVARDLPRVRADGTRLKEVLLNLVDNAVKYTPEGGKLEVEASVEERALQVSVSDTGVGIPPENGELIFEPFYRVKGTHSQHGEASTGLGLALVKRLVEAQGGSISYVSEPGSGTTFTFTLPLADHRVKVPNDHVSSGSKGH